VIDLSAGDAVAALKLLWREVSEYEAMRGRELNAETERRTVVYKPANMKPPPSDASDPDDTPTLDPSPEPLPFLSSTPISSKPWFVVATKADLADTQENFEALRRYLGDVTHGAQPHPSNRKHAWRRCPQAVPVSAIKAEGVEVIPQVVMDMLEE
jgi:GTP-binding protein